MVNVSAAFDADSAEEAAPISVEAAEAPISAAEAEAWALDSGAG